MPSLLPTFFTPANIPFLLHILLELPASITFFLSPSTQLQLPSPPPTPRAYSQAHALIRQYAVLLLVSNLVALICVLQPTAIDDILGIRAEGKVVEVERLRGNVAGALAVYHLAPLVRAVGRMVNGDGHGHGHGHGRGYTTEQGNGHGNARGRGGRTKGRKGRGTAWGLKGLGGPWVHAVGHLGCLVALAGLFLGWWHG